MPTRLEHWERVYRDKRSDEVSWFRLDHSISLELMHIDRLPSSTCVADVGGGDSTLVDALLEHGLSCVTVLDLSAHALERSRARVGAAGRDVQWLHADIAAADWDMGPVDVWHDRAVFHFLTDPADQARYVARLHRHVKPEGRVIIATFAPEGPERCSGLPVARYSPQSLHETLGPGFTMVEWRDEAHHTPGGRVQQFQWSLLTRNTSDA